MAKLQIRQKSQITLRKSSARQVSFESSQHRVLSTDSTVRHEIEPHLKRLHSLRQWKGYPCLSPYKQFPTSETSYDSYDWSMVYSIISNACLPKRFQKSFRRKLVPIPLILYWTGNTQTKSPFSNCSLSKRGLMHICGSSSTILDQVAMDQFRFARLPSFSKWDKGWSLICGLRKEPTYRFGWSQAISMEFLRSFLRRHFAGKPVPGGVTKCRLFSQAIWSEKVNFMNIIRTKSFPELNLFANRGHAYMKPGLCAFPMNNNVSVTREGIHATWPRTPDLKRKTGFSSLSIERNDFKTVKC